MNESRGWFGAVARLLGGGRGSPPPRKDEARSVPRGHVTRFRDQHLYVCCVCGAALGADPDDSLHAEGPNRHLCGNCYRSREWDAILEHEFYEHHG